MDCINESKAIKLYFMITKTRLLAFCSVITLLFFATNVKAENRRNTYDSTCCAPDSLRVVSTNYPVFCVSWNVHIDSTCRTPQAFEIQWKPLFGTIWKSKIVPYTSGTTINFCDSVDTCGTYLWRVRTICDDSTYSDWVDGKKFTIPCDHDGPNNTQYLSISPNPASESITISVKYIRPGPIKISIVNMAGKNVLDKIANAESNKFREKISINGWRRGIYFVNILANGVVISRGSFVKE